MPALKWKLQKLGKLGYFSGLRGEVAVRSTIPFTFPEESANVGLYVNGFPHDDFSGVLRENI